MYHKDEINKLYCKYTETREEASLASLITECEPIIDIVLTRYKKYSRHTSDMKQEVLLRLWKNLRLRPTENLTRYLINPTSYLFFLIRTYCTRAWWRMFHVVHKEEHESSLDSIASTQADMQAESYDG